MCFVLINYGLNYTICLNNANSPLKDYTLKIDCRKVRNFPPFHSFKRRESEREKSHSEYILTSMQLSLFHIHIFPHVTIHLLHMQSDKITLSPFLEQIKKQWNRKYILLKLSKVLAKRWVRSRGLVVKAEGSRLRGLGFNS